MELANRRAAPAPWANENRLPEMPNEPDYDPLIDEFKKSGQMPLLWQWTAREFVCSANILRNAAQNTSLFPDNKKNTDQLWKPKIAIWLLYGLALENLVKGLLVAQGIDAYKDNMLACFTRIRIVGIEVVRVERTEEKGEWYDDEDDYETDSIKV